MKTVLRPLDKILKEDKKALLLLCIVSLVFLFAIPFNGGFGLNDDPTYAKAVKDFAFAGKYYPENYASTMLLQIIYATIFVKLFGFSHEILRISVMLLSVLGVLLFFVLARQFGFSKKHALLLAMLLLVNPFFVVLGHSFMTDVPFTVLFLAAAIPLVEWAKSREKKALVAGCLMLLLGFFIKQWALLFFFGLAFFVFFLSKSEKKEKIIIVATLAAFAVALAWSLPHYALDDAGTYFKPVGGKFVLPLLFGLPFYAAFFLFPFSIALLLEKRQLKETLAKKKLLVFSVLFALVGIIAGLLAFNRFFPYFSNVLNPLGMGPKFLVGTATGIIPEWFWVVISLLAAASLVFFIQSLNPQSFKKKEKLLVGCMIAVYFVQMLANSYFIDRYFLPMLPIIFLLLLEPLKEKKHFVAGLAATIVFFAAFSFVFTSEYMAWNEKAWQLINELKAQGVPEGSIDGGHEYCEMTFGQSETRLLRTDTKYFKGICGKGCVEKGYAIAFKPIEGCSIEKSEPYFVFGAKFGEIFVLKK